jgi:hypothetical protein
MQIFWRPRSRDEWSEGACINVSRSGVLFQSDQLLAAGTELELVFALSWDSSYLFDGADVRCFGQIVRTEGDFPGAPLIASTIHYYSLVKLA